MNALLELHILQNFAPSNLNRDDTGSPKDAIFGGYRRARISSQSLKRAMRTHVREHKLLEPEDLAIRTKQLVEALTTRLKAHGHDAEISQQAASTSVAAMGSQKNFKLDKDFRTDYLVFLGVKEIDKLAATISENIAELGAKKPAVSKDLKKALEGALDGGQAVDVALFGRMLANLPERNQDAACQVAHALSTHKVEREFDFFTAVDDLKEQDDSADAGAGMLGTVEFNSACYYRYLVIDLKQLKHNLQGDMELVQRGLEAFLRAAIMSAPSGKQNTFAAHNPPSFIALTTRRDASPRNLVNAFEQPAKPHLDEGEIRNLTQASVKKLEAHWTQLEAFYGQPGQTVLWNGTGAEVSLGEQADSLDALVLSAVTRALASLRA
jgi:CRISPR system Cascade subunit CasC